MISMYTHNRFRCKALIDQAVDLHRNANQMHPNEFYRLDSDELRSVRVFSKYVIERALDEYLFGLDTRIMAFMKECAHWGFVAGNLSTADGNSGTGTWMVRMMTLRRMLAATLYIPFASPGDRWNIDGTRVSIYDVNATEYSWNYDISMQTEEQEYGEEFEVTDSFESYYWSLVRQEPRFVPYPFEGLYNIKRESLEQTVGIAM